MSNFGKRVLWAAAALPLFADDRASTGARPAERVLPQAKYLVEMPVAKPVPRPASEDDSARKRRERMKHRDEEIDRMLKQKERK